MTPEIPTAGSIADQTLSWARARGLKTWFAKETTSTNSIAKDHAPLSQTTLFLAESQTAGRGRGDHTWTTPKNALLSTWTFALNYAPQPILSPLIGLCLYEACVRAFPDLAFSLKAPNDLYVGQRKIAGILIENVAMTHVTCAIGVGFNAGEAAANVETSVGLAELLPDVISRWPTFLEAWFMGLSEAVAESRATEISMEKRARLREALNAFEGLKEKVLNVGSLGQIQTTSRFIDWNEL